LDGIVRVKIIGDVIISDGVIGNGMRLVLLR
jgi:hypothetical protein